MKKTLTLILTILLHSFSHGQTATELYSAKNYQELVKLEKESDKLTPDELYMLGFAFFQLENDNKAIEFYDKAISKGLDDASVHFYKGLSLRYMKKFEEAMKEIEIAIKKEPANQKYVNEKGLIFYYQGNQDKALPIFEEAKKLPNTFGEPFFWVAHIYHEKQEFAKALALYYETLDNLPKTNEYYLTTLEMIGQIEYTSTKNYLKSAKAYTQAININQKNYELYPKLIKAYNGAEKYAKADSIFELMKVAYNNKELSEDEMNYKSIAIDEFEWNEQKVIVYRFFVDPQEPLDISYKVYLLTKTGDKVERTFIIEKTIQLPKGPKHLLCEKDKKTGSHITYPYGWKTDTIPFDDLKKAVILVLDGKIKQGASSNFGGK